ncbi:inorganic phosphate transporter [Oscillospiraceae bacterium MB08-C2-2]|nr:inorganic phosphate transporter [Oscillospiraceae bacterium MB08-C2-2]
MNYALITTVVLVLAVIFVNGWTDAPNAIATAISTRVLAPRTAIWMAVVFNFFGALVMTLFNARVAATISNMVSFEGGTGNEPKIALAASLFAIVVWATAAWYFGIPTSESHALIAGLTGSAMAMGGLGAVNFAEWSKVLIGLVISSVLGFGSGFGVVKLIEKICYNMNRPKTNKVFFWGQAGGAAAMAFLHGAQDGQKFMGVFMLGLFLNGMDTPMTDGSFNIPLWVIVMCSVVMGLGTSVGGMRIIKAVGMDMVKLEKYQGFAADLSAAVCLLFSTVLGIPVSTTHTKTTAIMGVGAARRLSTVDWRIVKEMVWAWVLTFPGCGLIGFLMAKLFIAIF